MARSGRRALGLLLALTLVVSGANAWLLVRRGSGYSLRLVPYDDVYRLDETPRVRDVRADGATLSLEVSDSAGERWRVDRDQTPIATAQGGSLRLPLEPGRHAYRLVPESARPGVIEFTALYVPGEPVFIGDTNVRFGGDAPFSLADFAVAASAYPPDRRERAQAVLEAAGVGEASSDLERIERLAGHLLRELAPQRGTPSPSARLQDGIGQYELALAGETKVHCGNLSEIYGALANLAGIPTRIVDVRGEVGGARLGAHTFAESYLPELREWAYVDLQLEVLHVRSPSGRALNGAQLLQLHEAGAEAGLEATVFRDGGIVREPYERVSREVALLLQPSASLNYHFADTRRFSLPSRLLRHTLRPEPAYALGGTNLPLWTRVAAQIAVLLTAGVWLALGVRRMAELRVFSSRPRGAEPGARRSSSETRRPEGQPEGW
jgi:hypothetical protein